MSARTAVEKIIEDINARRGLRQVWEEIDEENRDEIAEEWMRIIKEEVKL